VQAGLPAGFHFHDLRHTGNNLAAASGASTRELMHRMGHGSMRAALIYQHATGERDREIANALQFRIERELKEMGPIEGPRLGVDGPSLGQAPQKESGD
jgi:integrase